MLKSMRLRFVMAALLAALSIAAMPAAMAADEAESAEVDAAGKDLLAAHGLFTRGLFKLAADDYAAFLKKHPKHDQATVARYALAVCHYRLSRHEDAAGELQTVLADAKFKQRDEALAVLGHCRLALNDHKAALAALEEILARHGDTKHAEWAALTRAQVLYRLDRKADAVAACKAFLEKHPKSPSRADGLYTLALAEHALAKFAPAEEALKKLIKESPASPYAVDAAMLLGRSQEAQKKLDAAAATFKAMVDTAPAARQPEVLYRLAVVMHNSGKHAEATAHLRKILSDHEKSPFAGPAMVQLGKTQYDANQIGEARKTLAAVAKQDKDHADEARYWLAQCDIAEGKYEAALKALEPLAKNEPAAAHAEDAAFFAAICRMQLDKFDEAVKAFVAFRGRFTASARAIASMHHQAYCLHRLEKYDESRKLCEQVAASDDKTWHDEANKLWAENLFLMKQYAAASQKFAQLIPKAANEADKLLFQARIAQAAYLDGDFKRAAELMAPLAANDDVAKRADLRQLLLWHGDALIQTGDFKSAADALSRYLKLVPDDAEAAYKLGLAQQQSGNDDAAMATYAKITGGKMESTWVQHALLAYGQIAYRKQQPDKAGPALAKVAGVDAPPAVKAPAMYLLAWIDFDAKRYEEAAKGFDQLLKAFPKHEFAADAMYQRGICLMEAGKTQEALAALNGYIAAHPQGKRAAAARQSIGAALAKLGKNDEAAKMLATLAADKSARTDAVLYDLAWSQRALKADDAAIKTYQQLLAEFKSSKLATPARIELAELLYAKEQHKEAAALLETALKDEAIDEKTLAAGRYRLGWCYARLEEHAKAAAAFAQFAAAYPKDPLAASALYQSGMAHRTTGKLAEAQQQFSAVIAQHPKDELAPAALLRLGETQADAGQYAQSAASYQKFIEGHPKSEFLHRAFFGAGWAAEQQKQYEAARDWYAKVIEKSNTETAARAQFQIGETHFAQKKFESAARELLKVEIVYDYPAWSAKALYEAGQAFEQLGRRDEAKAQYKRCAEKYPQESVARLAKSRLEALANAGT